eukprot:6933171-Alexandrium_andersonii.AAC.1
MVAHGRDGMVHPGARAAQSCTATSHVARILGGGLHGPAGPRTAAQRALTPRRCCCCAAEAVGCAWRTPRDG